MSHKLRTVKLISWYSDITLSPSGLMQANYGGVWMVSEGVLHCLDGV